LLRSLAVFERLWSRRATEAPALALVLYSRRDCPLCDELERELTALAHAPRYELRKVDIDSDATLVARYGRSVPVLEHAGRVLCKGRIEPAELERRLVRAARERAR
jgi:glutaredoxin